MLVSMTVRLVAITVLLLAPLQAAKHVVLVSIDGFAAYHLLNEDLELPNIRGLIKQGVWYSASETVFPSVTHPSHTTILTGVSPRRHGVLSNGMTNRDTGESFHPTNKPRLEIVKVPTLFDAAKRKGLKTSSFYWPETKDDPSIDFNIAGARMPDGRIDVSATDPEVLDELRDAGVPIDLYFDWRKTELAGAGDVILTRAAAHSIKVHRPNLLAVHLLVTDYTQHQYGPQHYKAQWALSRADYCVGLLREAVREAGLADETVFVVTADHGFHSVSHELDIRPAFAEDGLLDHVELRGGGWSLSVVEKKTFDSARDQPKLERAFAKLLQHENVFRIFRPDDLHALGQPRYEEDPHALGHYFVIPDLDTHLVANDVSAVMERRLKASPSHGHGYLPQHPRMYTSLVFSGKGVKSGVTLPKARNLDIAPTIAVLLGLELNGVEGAPLKEALVSR